MGDIINGNSSIKLLIVTPDGIFQSSSSSSIMVKTVDGWLGFLPGRAPVCALLPQDGGIRFRNGAEEHTDAEGFCNIRISGGFLVMDKNMTVYTDGAAYSS